MSIWGAVCFMLGHEWSYKRGYRICLECKKIEPMVYVRTSAGRRSPKSAGRDEAGGER